MRKPPIEEAKRWLDQAREDLIWAKRLSNDGGYHIACFLSQQIAEKALKAFLYSKGEVQVFGHSVSVLADRMAQYEKSVKEKVSDWSILDGFYIPTRYPNGLPDSIPARIYNKKTAQEAVDLANDVVLTVSSILNI